MDISDAPDKIRNLLSSSTVVAVVGASDKPERPSYGIARYLQDAGYTMIPVNPTKDEILGQKCYPDLASIPTPVDIAVIFRNPADVPPIVEAAIRIRAKAVWMQTGIAHAEAARRAVDAGLWVLQDRCIQTLHRLLLR
jgi:hypothetical protein